MSYISFLVSTAQAATNDEALGKVLGPIISHIIDPIIGLMFAVAVVVFAYGVFQVVWNKTDAESYSKGKASMWGGLIGMFIMVSAWGIIYLISNTVKAI